MKKIWFVKSSWFNLNVLVFSYFKIRIKIILEEAMNSLFMYKIEKPWQLEILIDI